MASIDSFYNKVYSFSNRSAVSRRFERLVPYRQWIVITAHLFLFALSYSLSFLMLSPLMEGFEAESVFLWTVFPLLFIRSVVFAYHDLYQGLWRYVSFPDLLNIIRATVISSLCFALAGMVVPPLRVPDRILVLDLVFCIGLAGGVRFLVRSFREKFLPAAGGMERDKILLIGPLAHVQPLVNEIHNDPLSRYRPI